LAIVFTISQAGAFPNQTTGNLFKAGRDGLDMKRTRRAKKRRTADRLVELARQLRHQLHYSLHYREHELDSMAFDESESGVCSPA
jgi:siderophore synthetase component